MKLTKIKIEKLANEIKDFLMENDYESDVCIYFNNRRMSFKVYDDNWQNLDTPMVIIKDDISPLKYFKYVNTRHILSMSFGGGLHSDINYGSGRAYSSLEKIFSKYGLYFEQGNDWNLTAYPNPDLEYEDIEYTDYSSQKEKEPIYIGMNQKEKTPWVLSAIMDIWYNLSEKHGNKGSCVKGAGFVFEYEKERYHMLPCSPYQGSCSWESGITAIESILEEIGATNIKYNWGVLD